MSRICIYVNSCLNSTYIYVHLCLYLYTYMSIRDRICELDGCHISHNHAHVYACVHPHACLRNYLFKMILQKYARFAVQVPGEMQLTCVSTVWVARCPLPIHA